MTFILSNDTLRVAVPRPEDAPAALRQLITERFGADPGEIHADGQWHKFKTARDGEKANGSAGSYLLDFSGPSASFGSHRPTEPAHVSVIFEFPGKDSAERQAQAEAIRRRTEAFTKECRDQAAAEAFTLYQAGQPLAGELPYLAARGVAAAAVQFGKLRTDDAGSLLVPMADAAGTLRNLQAIRPDGTKRFIKGGETAGLFLGIPRRPEVGETFYLAEGLAKALAVWTATGSPTICAFSAGNLAAVVRQLDPVRAIVAADGDDAGGTAAEECRQLGARVIYPPAGSGDWNDILTRQGLDALRALLTQAPAEGPLPLFRELPTPAPFPLDALGELGDAAAVVVEQVGVSPALAGTAFLMAANTAAHGLGDVAVNRSLTVPLSLFALAFSESGTGKSPSDRMAFAPARDWEAAAADLYELAAESARDAAEEWADRKETIKADMKKARAPAEDIAAALAELGPPPTPPTLPTLMVDDPTLEGLSRLYREGARPALATVTDEAGRIIGGWSLNGDNAAKTLSGLSKFWDGATVKIARGTGDAGLTILRNRRLAVYWATQPVTAAKVFSDPLFYGQGFLPRCLLITPEAGDPKPVEDRDMAAHPAMLAHHTRIRALLDLPLATREGKPFELEPRQLTLAADARPKFFSLWNQIKLATGKEGAYADLREYAAKAHDNLLRIAGTLTLYHDPAATEIPTTWLHGAARLIQFYIEEFRRIRSGAEVAAPLLEARRLLEWCERTGREFIYPRLIYREGPNAIRDKKAALRAVATLAEHGYLLPIPEGMTLDGAHRREVWQLIRGAEHE